MNGTDLPTRWNWLVRGFCRYVKRYLRQHFHAVRLSLSGASFPTDGEPILIVANHPSWWDALIGIPLLDSLEGYQSYAPMHVAMLKQYPLFTRLGFFGVNPESFRSAAEFLLTGCAILSEPNRALWITAQGQFTDVRTRPLNLKSGVGHLAARMKRGWVVCLAIEYAFWDERTPEVLLRLAEPIAIDSANRSGKDWTAKLEAILTESLDTLNRETQSRDPAKFATRLAGRSGVGGGYDWLRCLVAWLRFRRFRPTHREATS